MATMETKKKVGGEACGAINCTNSRFKCPGKSFYRFPKQEERCRLWVQKTRRYDLISKSTERLHKGTLLCEDHFEVSQFKIVQRAGSTHKRLLKNAVPTLFDLPEPPDLLTPRKGLPVDEPDPPSLPSPCKALPVDVPSPPSLPAPCTELTPKRLLLETEVDASASSVSPKRAKIHDSPDKAEKCCLDVTTAAASPVTQTTVGSATVLALQKKVKQLQGKVRRQIRRAEKKKKKPPKLISLPMRKKLAIKHLSHLFSGMAFQFWTTQINLAKTDSKGHRWSDSDKSFALSLLHASPKAYQFIKKYLYLPDEKTLRRTVQKNKNSVVDVQVDL